jgi:hypothetical protein
MEGKQMKKKDDFFPFVQTTSSHCPSDGLLLARILTRQLNKQRRCFCSFFSSFLSSAALHPDLSCSSLPRLTTVHHHGGLPRRLPQGASTLRPRRPRCSALPRPSSLPRQAAQAALRLRGLHGGNKPSFFSSPANSWKQRGTLNY